jgi:predicted nucleic acid-binding protein
MNVECFLDTNVLVYAVGSHGEDERKRLRALEVIEPGGFATSGQVLQEFYVNVTRKIQKPLSAASAIEWIDRLSLRPVVPIDATLIRAAVDVSSRFRISYWDGAILAAAAFVRAPLVYTEDLNHGQIYGSVRVLNPFREH